MKEKGRACVPWDDGEEQSELPGDDGERHHGAAGLQLQCSEEAIHGRLALALGLQHFAQALPRFMACALSLHSIPQHLLGQVPVAPAVQNQALGAKQVCVVSGGLSWAG